MALSRWSIGPKFLRPKTTNELASAARRPPGPTSPADPFSPQNTTSPLIPRVVLLRRESSTNRTELADDKGRNTYFAADDRSATLSLSPLRSTEYLMDNEHGTSS